MSATFLRLCQYITSYYQKFQITFPQNRFGIRRCLRFFCHSSGKTAERQTFSANGIIKFFNENLIFLCYNKVAIMEVQYES